MEIHGHRGARWSRPENTMPAFRFAAEAGVQVLEMDLHVTKDDHLVVTHDPFLSTEVCRDEKGQAPAPKTMVRSLTLKQVQSYDCGSKVHPRFPTQTAVPGTKIPTLAQVFGEFQKGSLHFNIETKSDPAHPEWTPGPEEFVKLILAEVKKFGLRERVILQSFDIRTLQAAQKLNAGLRLAYLVETRPKDMTAIWETMSQTGIQILSPSSEWLTATDVTVAHERKFLVVPWTVNSESGWKKVSEMKVDGVITDNPKGLVDWLRKSGRTSQNPN